MVTVRRLTADAFDKLATGVSSPQTLALLKASQGSRRLLQLRLIAEAAPELTTDALDLLAAAQQRSAPVVSEVLSAPWVGVWAADCLRKIRRSPSSSGLRAADVSYLSALAAVAAMRTGMDAEFRLLPQHGLIVLPGVGGAVTDAPFATVTVRSGLVTMSDGAKQGPLARHDGRNVDGWYGRHQLVATAHGATAVLDVDDFDFYRDCFQTPMADPRDRRLLSVWQDRFETAWSLLTRWAPARAADIAHGLRTLAPYAHAETGPGRSATSPRAFGALGASVPPDGAAFGATLVHELQHSKLSALLHLIPLYDPDVTITYTSPWRTDPRPLGGLLQGAFAFLAVADYWRLLRAEPSLGRLAETEFARIRAQVGTALDILDTNPHLTPAGAAFVHGLSTALDRILAEPVSREARQAAAPSPHG